MERTETKMDRELLEALRRRADEEGRDEYEVLEDAARFYLRRGRASITELVERARERRERAGIPEPSEEEAMRLAVAEQHAHRDAADQ